MLASFLHIHSFLCVFVLYLTLIPVHHTKTYSKHRYQQDFALKQSNSQTGAQTTLAALIKNNRITMDQRNAYLTSIAPKLKYTDSKTLWVINTICPVMLQIGCIHCRPTVCVSAMSHLSPFSHSRAISALSNKAALSLCRQRYAVQQNIAALFQHWLTKVGMQ